MYYIHGDECGVHPYADRPNIEHYAAIDRLAAYEDSGLEPDMVVKTAELAFFVHENGLDRLRDLLAAEKDGRLVVLPCKVGDSGAWVHNGTMTPVHVHRIQINKRGTFLVLKSTVVHGAFPVDQIGKTVFLTREEAEAALRGDKR